MSNPQAATLTEVARTQAAAGDGWAALNAQMAADTLVVADELAERPDILADIGPLKTAELADQSLAGTIAGYRQALLGCLSPWGVAGSVGEAFAVLDLPELPLDPETAGEFAEEMLEGADVDTFAQAQADKATRLYRLGSRLREAGDLDGALNCAHAADTAAFLSHHASEGAGAGDGQMSVLRTAVLLADHHLAIAPDVYSHEESMTVTRHALDTAVVTAAPLDWESFADRN